MTFDLRRFVDRHQAGVTIALTGIFAVILSLPPFPEAWAPLDFVREPGLVRGLAKVLFTRPGGGARGGGDPAEAVDQAPEQEDPVKEEVVPVAARTRATWKPPERARYEEMRGKVGADPKALVNPCVETNGDTCSRFALDRFFSRLSLAEDGRPEGIVRVVHFGDSLIASDHITDLVRQRLHERFGSAGRGTLFVDRLSRFAGRRVRTGVATDGWRLDVITQSKPVDRAFSYTGASFTAEKDGEKTVFDVGSNRRVDLTALKGPEGGVLEALADGRSVTKIELRAEQPSTESFSFTLPEGTKQLELVARTRGVRIHGVSLEAGVPGVVYESLGLPGATSKVWLVPEESSFAAQLRRRDPALIVTMLGGNDALMLSKKRTTIEDIEGATREFVGRLRRSVPTADCLMVSPMDSARVSVGGGMVSKPEVELVRAAQIRVADSQGCAFWDMWGSMGGTGALERWFNAKMINPDMIHPMGYGGDLLGELMVTSLMKAYDAWHQGGQVPVMMAEPVVLTLDEIPIGLDEPAPTPSPAPSDRAERGTLSGGKAPEPGAPPVLEIPSGEALGPFFGKLQRLERDKAGRAEIAVFGANAIAGHRFTDELRLRLAKRFGDRGRGYVAAGRGVKALSDNGVERVLSGAFEVREGRQVPRVGMSGVRTELKRGAKFRYAPCTRDCPGGVASVFDLFFLVEGQLPDTRVKVTGVKDDPLNRTLSARDEGPTMRRYTTRGPKPELEVEVTGAGSLTLLGVSHELDRPGVVVDPIALSGATPSSALRWDQEVVISMLAKREPDLLVLAYGDVEGQAEAIDAAAYRRDYARLLRRLRVATDDGPCLVIGPLSSLREKHGEWREFGALAEIDRVQREVALEEGCAFWDARRALGGETAILRWIDEAPQRLSLDRRSFSDEGIRIVAGLFLDDLLHAYAGAGASPGPSDN